MRDYLFKFLTVLFVAVCGMMPQKASAQYIDVRYEYTDSICNAEVKTTFSVTDSVILAHFYMTYYDTIPPVDDDGIDVIFDENGLDVEKGLNVLSIDSETDPLTGTNHYGLTSEYGIRINNYKPDTLYNFTIRFGECEVVRSLRTPSFMDNSDEHSVDINYGYTDSICNAEVETRFNIRDSVIYADFSLKYNDTNSLEDDTQFEVKFDESLEYDVLTNDYYSRVIPDPILGYSNCHYELSAKFNIEIKDYKPDTLYNFTIRFGECEVVRSLRTPALRDTIGAIYDIESEMVAEPPFYVYDMNGMLVKEDSEKMPIIDELDEGIYVVKCGNGTKKVLVRKRR